MEAIVGPEPGKYVAKAIQRVIELAYDEGHPDPRHSEHWWDWKDWPFDGRQWDYDGSINRYQLDKNIHSEWKRRQKQACSVESGESESDDHNGSGMEASGLKVQRKLEGGMLWKQQKFPNGRTCIRSSSKVDILPSVDIEKFKAGMFNTVVNLTNRASYDAAIKPDKPIQDLPMNDQFKQEYTEAINNSDNEKLRVNTIRGSKIVATKFFGCTGPFAVKGEQEYGEESVPSLMVGALVLYQSSIGGIHNGGIHNLFVVAEVPMRPMGMEETFIEASFNRLAGFVFNVEDIMEEGGKSSGEAITVTYVESCDYDLDTLDHDEKDAVLEDRALIVHRLLKNCPGADPSNLLLEVSFPRHLPAVKPVAEFSLPPYRTVSFMSTVHRADPRWPLVKPNSVCLECGKDPTNDGGKLLHCSKCSVRRFCSSKCMAKSWRSDTWSHKVECTSWCNVQQGMLGSSLEDKFREMVEEGGKYSMQADELDANISMLEQAVGSTTLNARYDSLEEMRDGERQRAKENRKAKRDGKKGKKKGKKKK